MALTNEQFNTLMRLYSSRQARNRQVIAEHTEKLYANIPELSSLDEQHAQYALQQLQYLLEGAQADADEMRLKMEQISAQRQKLMADAKVPEGYLVPPYTCPDCQDTGFINNQRCHCFIQESINLVYSQSHLDDILDRENFETFSLDFYSTNPLSSDNPWSPLDYAKDSLEKCLNFVQNFDADGGNLLLFGDTGTGKTFLSNCVAKALMESNHSVVYFTASQFVNIFDIKNKGEATDAEKEQISSCELLIIDDLGTEFTNTYNSAQFFACLNDRLLHSKSTLISTNLSIDDIRDRYSERVSSRILQSYTLCQLFGDDIRVQKTFKK